MYTYKYCLTWCLILSCHLTFAQNVGIGIETPLAKFHLNGNQKIEGGNTLEFGSGLTKEMNAGKIGYKTFSSNGLDIIGAGTTLTNRKIFLYAEGGSTFNGNVSLQNNGKMLLGTDTPLSTYQGSLLQLYSGTHEIRLLMKGANGGSNYNNLELADAEGSSWSINHKSQAWVEISDSFDHLISDCVDQGISAC